MKAIEDFSFVKHRDTISRVWLCVLMVANGEKGHALLAFKECSDLIGQGTLSHKSTEECTVFTLDLTHICALMIVHYNNLSLVC